MAKEKRQAGRPKSSDRADVSIKFDKILAGKARMIAVGKGISMAEYLSGICQPIIDRDFAKLARDKEAAGL